MRCLYQFWDRNHLIVYYCSLYEWNTWSILLNHINLWQSKIRTTFFIFDVSAEFKYCWMYVQLNNKNYFHYCVIILKIYMFHNQTHWNHIIIMCKREETVSISVKVHVYICTLMMFSRWTSKTLIITYTRCMLLKLLFRILVISNTRQEANFSLLTKIESCGSGRE